MRRVTVIAAAALAAAAGAVPAHAETAGTTVTESATGIQASMGNDRSAVTFACTASSTSPSTIATEVRDCFLLGADGQRWYASSTGAKPLAVDASAGAQVLVPEQVYRVCVRTRTLSRDAQTYVETPVSCHSVTRVS